MPIKLISSNSERICLFTAEPEESAHPGREKKSPEVFSPTLPINRKESNAARGAGGILKSQGKSGGPLK
jgi:hypothetical protein